MRQGSAAFFALGGRQALCPLKDRLTDSGSQRLGAVCALAVLRTELERDLALLGCARVVDLSPQFLRNPEYRSNRLAGVAPSYGQSS